MYLISEGENAGIDIDELINRRRKDGANLIELATLLAPGLAKQLVSRKKKLVRSSILRRNVRRLEKFQAKQDKCFYLLAALPVLLGVAILIVKSKPKFLR